jgi:hypothetical protein
VKFSADLTQKKVKAIWGEPDLTHGPGFPASQYMMEDGAEVWLFFQPEPPHKIKHANFHKHLLDQPSSDQVSPAYGRGLADIHFTSDLKQEQVEAIWGVPDGHRGSGISYIEYTLGDDAEVWLDFQTDPPHKALEAILFKQLFDTGP